MDLGQPKIYYQKKRRTQKRRGENNYFLKEETDHENKLETSLIRFRR